MPPSAKRQLAVTGMTCVACVGRVERALSKVEGVSAVEVNLLAERASIQGEVEAEALVEAVRCLGFGAEVVEDPEEARQRREAEQQQIQRCLGQRSIIAVLLTLPIFCLEMSRHFIPGFGQWLVGIIPHEFYRLFIALVASVVQFGPGFVFYRRGIPSLLHRAPDMNGMVMLGTSAAWLYSVVVCFAPSLFPDAAQVVYFEASAVVISLVLLGRYVEGRAKGRSGDTIRQLLALQVPQACVLRDGLDQTLPIDDLALGDAVRLRAGEQVPVDAVVQDGNCVIDEAMLSGESLPLHKNPGDSVVAGTMVVDGFATVQVSALGANTVLAQMVAMVENAQSSKLPIQQLVDRVTALFVPIVLVIACCVVLGWVCFSSTPSMHYALICAVSVLIIACPCAMGLATPISIVVGIGCAAERGVLFRRGAAMQALAQVDVIAFDKTGTLTTGEPQVVHRQSFHPKDLNADQLLGFAASVEQGSVHPLARAIVQAAEAAALTLVAPRQVQVFTGQGISAQIDGKLIVVGSASCLIQHAAVDEKAFSAILPAPTHSHVYIAVDGQLLGVVTLADSLRPEAKASVEALQNAGKSVRILSGDHHEQVASIAAALNLPPQQAGQLPQDKLQAIAALQEAGHKVAFVGDGMNDAPALAQADVGIAIGSGTAIAVESADIVLRGSDLRRVPETIVLSRRCMRNIRQNLFWAFAYNTALIPIAAGLLYPLWGILLSPMLAALAMTASSLCVVGNALRLKRGARSQPKGGTW